MVGTSTRTDVEMLNEHVQEFEDACHHDEAMIDLIVLLSTLCSLYIDFEDVVDTSKSRMSRILEAVNRAKLQGIKLPPLVNLGIVDRTKQSLN